MFMTTRTVQQIDVDICEALQRRRRLQHLVDLGRPDDTGMAEVDAQIERLHCELAAARRQMAH